MKRILLIVSAIVLCTKASYAIGQIDGIYQIVTPQDLRDFAALVNGGDTTACAQVTANIDASSENFTPIGTSDNQYAGTFDGGFHNIKLSITNDGENQGLFGVTCGCTITSVTVSGTVNGTSNVGGIVGCVQGANDIITKCINEAAVTGTGGCVGGIVGLIRPNASDSEEDTELAVTITACANRGNVNGRDNEKSGSMVGLIESGNMELTACYNEQTANGLALYSQTEDYGFIVTTNCYDINGEDDITGAFDFTTEDLTNGTLCGNLNLSVNENASDGPWYQQIGEDEHPVLTADENEANVVNTAWMKEYGNDKDEGHIVCFNNDKIELNDNAAKFYELRPFTVTETALNNLKYNCTEKAKNILVCDNESWYCGYAELQDSLDYTVEYDYEAAKFVYDRLLTTTNKGISTFMLPIATNTSNVNGKVYKLSTYSDGVLHFDEVTGEIEAGVPYIIENTSAENKQKLLKDTLQGVNVKGIGDSSIHSISTEDDAATQHGTYSKITSEDSEHADLFADQDVYGYTGGQFVKATGTWTLPAFRTLITIPTEQSAAHALSIDLEGSDIAGMACTENSNATTADVYSVAGVKVRRATTPDKAMSDLPAGIYIVNGKKIVKRQD